MRAVAVWAVILYHAGSTGFSGGYVGVDVFFVLSGFLITSIIFDELERGTFTVARFYERRARRILPALLSTLVLTSVASVFILAPTSLRELGEAIAATLGFGSNVLFWLRTGYFDGPAMAKPLLHTWSLAVEEQFYLGFPLLCIVLFSRGKRRMFIGLCAVALTSFAASAATLLAYRDANFYLIPFRAWELMVGALLALAPRRLTAIPRALTEVVAVAGLVMIGVCVATYHDKTSFPGPAALWPCLGTALVVWATESGARGVTGVLSFRPLVGQGLLSYSLYLWHVPVLVLGRELVGRDLSLAERAACIALSVVGAAASWQLIEAPFRNRAMPVRRVLAATGAATLALAVFGTLAILTPLRLVLRPGAAGDLPYASTLERVHAYVDDQWDGIDRSLIQRFQMTFGVRGAEPTWLVWGDSMARSLTPLVHELAKRSGRAGITRAAVGCPPILDVHVVGIRVHRTHCNERASEVLELLRQTPFERVVLTGRWSLVVEGLSRRELGLDGWRRRYARTGDEESRIDDNPAVFEAALRDTIAAIRDTGAEVVLVGPFPEQQTDVLRGLEYHAFRGRALPRPMTFAEFDAREHRVIDVLRRTARELDVDVLWPHERLCDETTCDYLRDGHMMYVDGTHTSGDGNAVLVEGLTRTLAGHIASPSR